MLIKAFLEISDHFPNFRLKVVGHCHGRERERLHYRAMALGNDRVEILEPVLYDQAVKFIQSCTFLVLPSRTEATGRVLIEAMAAGKPVVGSNVGGIPDIIDNEINGFLFERCDVDDLARKIDILLSDGEMRSSMGRESLRIVSDRLSSHQYVDKFYSMIGITG